MEKKKNEPHLALVKKVSLIPDTNKLKVVFMYYATERLFKKINYEEVEISPEHPLVSELKKLHHGDELFAIPATDEIVGVYPHNWFIRFLIRQNEP